MERIILPTTDEPEAQVNKVIVDDRLVIGTITGLVKKNNEDRIGYLAHDDITRVCIADGHWGAEVAQIITKHWLEPSLDFPVSKKTAILKTGSVENEIYKAFGRLVMNPDKDFTPEASFVAVQISQKVISMASYGDCRLLIVQSGKITYEQPTTSTWLGVFSHSGLRGRLSVEEATIYKELPLENGSSVLIFTDGVDECIYEKPTISLDTLANLANQDSPEAVFNSILDEVFAYGAEDNASLAIVKN